MSSQRHLKSKVTRLGREIAEVHDHFYSQAADDGLELQSGMLERKQLVQ